MCVVETRPSATALMIIGDLSAAHGLEDVRVPASRDSAALPGKGGGSAGGRRRLFIMSMPVPPGELHFEDDVGNTRSARRTASGDRNPASKRRKSSKISVAVDDFGNTGAGRSHDRRFTATRMRGGSIFTHELIYTVPGGRTPLGYLFFRGQSRLSRPARPHSPRASGL